MSLLLKSTTLQARCLRTRQARDVRVAAAEPSAREWIDNWKTKQKAGNSRTPSWFPGTDLPEHLDGSLPGDYGFDPLGLAKDKAKLEWYVQAELQNARWAMLAVAGILGQELASKIGVSWPGAGVPWYEAGAFPYFASAQTLFGIMMLLFLWVENLRWQDMKKPGSVNRDPIFSNNKLADGNTPGYPGFDPFGYSKRADFETFKVKEIKNGRLAMLAFAGFLVQWKATGTTPLANLSAHLADPWNTTVWSNKLHIPL